MKRNIQIRVSLALLLVGAVFLTYSLTRLTVWSECDARYKAFIGDVNREGELTQYFHSIGQDHHLARFLAFRPSGRMYSGSNDSALPIVGAGALVLLSAFGLLDTLRRQKANQSAPACAESGRRED